MRMLERILVKNFALIDEASLEFHPKLNIFTGETGAGKTILIDALSIALGERFDPAFALSKTVNTLIEAVFNFSSAFLKTHPQIKEWMSEDDECLILRREIMPDGRNKCFINGKTVNVSNLREVGNYLADFHGQYDHQQILDPALHGSILDQFARIESELKSYQAIFSDYSKLKSELNQLESLNANRERECDLLKYQIGEIERIKPENNEDLELKEEHIRLANSERLHEHAEKILNLLSDDDGSVTEKIGITTRELAALSKIDESMKDQLSELLEAEIAITEIARAIEDYRDNLSFDENRLKEIERRLDEIEMLKRKYGGSIEAVLNFLKEIKARYDVLSHFEERNEELTKQLKTLEKKLQSEASLLTQKRKKAALKLKSAIEAELADLAIPKARFECRIEPSDPHESGMDKIEFFVSLNVGQSLEALAKIISGGEASRIMLAIKRALIDSDEIPTMIFDEIDANIGGRLGSIVGEKLSQISKKHQILLITHLPQIASFADNHIKVAKKVQGKQTKVFYQVLESDNRVKELSEMFSGEKETEISVEHAKQLLQNSGK